ncbi:hypothetical protein QTG56_01260 [Rossellomorea sp. AcN35-11]|nr:hypothetical protein [Rossellomorea aquimaris]WJV31678.1 hypothetical protein QTG56_01260 [Rossellomorea sp. AcN35-11]
MMEIFRIIILFFVLGALFGGTIKLFYASIGINVDETLGGLVVGLAIIIFLYVLYRNILQFSGFYKQTRKLSRKVSLSLLTCSTLLLVIAPFLR